MKNLIIYSSLLSIIFVLGACAGGDLGITGGTKTALAQIRGIDTVTDMETWTYASSDGIKTEIYYISDTKYKSICVFINPQEPNKISMSEATEGTLTKTTSFLLYARNGTTKFTDKKGYDTVYTFTPRIERWWINGKWIDGDLKPIHYIVKESPTELNLLPATSVPTGGYKTGFSYMTSADSSALSYKKQ